MFLIFNLLRPDVFPLDDIGLLRGDRAQLRRRSRRRTRGAAAATRRPAAGRRALASLAQRGDLVPVAQPRSVAGGVLIGGESMKTTFLDFEQPIAELEAEDRGAALRAGRLGGRHLRGDRAAAEEEPVADQGHLRQAHAVAGGAGGAPSAAAVHARLRRGDLHRLRRTARRPRLRRRPVDRRRAGALQRPAGDGDRPPEGARHQGARLPQLRHAAAGGLPQGAAADEAGREVRPAGVHLRRHAGRLSRHRRRGARPVRGDRPQPVRDGRAAACRSSPP